MRDDLDRLIVGYLVDDLSSEERAALQERLRRDPEACRRLVELSEQDFDLRGVLGNAAARRAATRQPKRVWLAALAAAVLCGIAAFVALKTARRSPAETVAREPLPEHPAPDRVEPKEQAPPERPRDPAVPPSLPSPPPKEAPAVPARPEAAPPAPREPEPRKEPEAPPVVPPPPPPRKEPERTRAAVAVLSRVEGRVLASLDGTEKEARAGQEILAGHVLKAAGPHAGAVLRFGDGTVAELREGTAKAEEGKRIHLVEGALDAEVPPQAKGETVVFTTPHAEVVVVGTQFRLAVNPAEGKTGTTRVEVDEGKVRFKSRLDGRTVDVSEGYHSVASAGTSLLPRRSPPTLGAAASRLKPGSWGEIRTKGFGRPLLDAGAGEHLLTLSQEAKWDPQARQVHVVGFAHPDRVRHVLYDERTNTWHPVPLKDPPSGLGRTYDHLAFNPVARKLYFRGFDSSTVHEYALADGSWGRLPILPRGTVDIGALEYFPEMNGLILSGSGDVWLYPFRSRAWKTLATGLELRSSYAWAEYDPVHKVMLLGEGKNARALYRVDASGRVERRSDPPVDLGDSEGTAVADPVGGKLLLLSRKQGGSFHEYDVPGDRWTRLETPPPALLQPPPSYTAAAALAEHGVILYLVSDLESSRTFLYKPPRPGKEK